MSGLKEINPFMVKALEFQNPFSVSVICAEDVLSVLISFITTQELSNIKNKFISFCKSFGQNLYALSHTRTSQCMFHGMQNNDSINLRYSVNVSTSLSYLI